MAEIILAVSSAYFVRTCMTRCFGEGKQGWSKTESRRVN